MMKLSRNFSNILAVFIVCFSRLECGKAIPDVVPMTCVRNRADIKTAYGLLTSGDPSLLDPYGRRITCKIVISLRENPIKRVLFTKNTFHLDTLSTSTYLKLDETSYTGTKFPDYVVSGTNKVHLHFVTAGRAMDKNATGFNITFKQVVYCGKPTPVSNGEYSTGDFIYQSVIDFTCNDGFQTTNSTTRICQNDGTWSGKEAICIKFDSNEDSYTGTTDTDTKHTVTWSYNETTIKYQYSSSEEGGSAKGLIIGLVVGLLVAVFIFLIIFIIVCKRRHRDDHLSRRIEYSVVTQPSIEQVDQDPEEIKSPRISELYAKPVKVRNNDPDSLERNNYETVEQRSNGGTATADTGADM